MRSYCHGHSRRRRWQSGTQLWGRREKSMTDGDGADCMSCRRMRSSPYGTRSIRAQEPEGWNQSAGVIARGQGPEVVMVASGATGGASLMAIKYAPRQCNTVPGVSHRWYRCSISSGTVTSCCRIAAELGHAGHRPGRRVEIRDVVFRVFVQGLQDTRQIRSAELVRDWALCPG